MYERLPTPFGLVRFGVAPDHPEVKNVIKDFGDVASTPGFRFFGNVEVGANQPSLSTLRQLYDAVVICTGAQGERLLNIPGEQLYGVVGAPAFVKWYNGHPDFVSHQFADPGHTAIVIGQGNVALDVARLLVRPPKDMHLTDMEEAAVETISRWQQAGLREVQVVGRRGFVQAAFTNAELRELLTVSDEVLAVVDPADLQLSRNPASEEEMSSSRLKKRSLEILEKMAANFAERETTSKRVIWLRFMLSPSEVLANGQRMVGLRLQRTELHGGAGKQVAVPSANSVDVEAGLLVRSVGFDLTPLEGLPMNERHRVPQTAGRVSAPSTEAAGLYVSGWAKRGPQGIVASNIADAQETSSSILADLSGQKTKAWSSQELQDALTSQGTRVVTFQDWQKLEVEELRRGQALGKAAAKFANVAEMLAFLSTDSR